jgi:hypothetical protein
MRNRLPESLNEERNHALLNAGELDAAPIDMQRSGR